uniref:Uncharacterized protein LOC105116878 n=1 Tax=Rhizophora mucronata TaxID=61149 RepID=A0A2P2PWZ4_RHIMU
MILQNEQANTSSDLLENRQTEERYFKIDSCKMTASGHAFCRLAFCSVDICFCNSLHILS